MRTITISTLPNQPCPAVNELMSCLETNIQFVNSRYGGINNQLPRLQWRSKGTLNRHDAGLALDIMLSADNPQEDLLAKNLVSFFLDYHDVLQWRGMIYRDVYFDGSKLKPQNYTQDRDHFTHIHIDWLDMKLVVKNDDSSNFSIGWPQEAMANNFTDIISTSLSDLSQQFDNNELYEVDLWNIATITVGPIEITNDSENN
jgi:hypothetical protein